MNTENVIEYIRRGNGLKFKNSFYWAEVLFLPVVILAIFIAGQSVGGLQYNISIAIIVAYMVNAFATIILLRKNSPAKYKFIVGFTFSCILLLLFSFFFTSLYLSLKLPEWRLFSYFVLLVFIPAYLAVLYNILLTRPKTVFSKKRPIKYTSITYGTTGLAALIRQLIGFLTKEYGHLLSDRTYELIMMYLCLIIMCVFSVSILDLQRYYYFTKLEKAGLVSEDILKPDEGYKA